MWPARLLSVRVVCGVEECWAVYDVSLLFSVRTEFNGRPASLTASFITGDWGE